MVLERDGRGGDWRSRVVVGCQRVGSADGAVDLFGALRIGRLRHLDALLVGS